MLKKIIILIFLLILLVIITSVFKGLSFQKTEVVVPIMTSTTSDPVVVFTGEIIRGNNSTTISDFLISDVSTTTYKIFGKYVTYKVIPYGIDYDPSTDLSPEPKICTAFTVLDGDVEIISKYKAMVERGNTINRIDEDGNLVLNINLTELSEEQKNFLVNSNSNILLKVYDKLQLGKGGNYCDSFIKLVSVEK